MKTRANQAERALLAKVDAAPFHALPSSELTPGQCVRAGVLVAEEGWLRWLPARGRWPARYVVTGSGHHAWGTFDWAHLDERRPLNP